MTGYGKAEVNLPDKQVTIEIKALNSKNMDSNVKLPVFYREKEMLIRKILQEELVRGKIDFNIFYELNEGITPSSVNLPVFRTYFSQIQELKKELSLDNEDIISTILRLPDAIKTDRPELNESEWGIVEKGIHNAIHDLQKFRIQEGMAMKEDLEKRVNNILLHLKSIAPFENERMQKMRERISKGLEELNLSDKTDTNRFEQEMIYYLEKLDISEEKTRLENHCRYFSEILTSKITSGKKLAFISQEMGREINTLGSKASESNIQHIVVQMKDELEKIKEQILNVL